MFSIRRKQRSIPGGETRPSMILRFVIIIHLYNAVKAVSPLLLEKSPFFFKALAFQSPPLLSRSKGRKKLINFNSNFKRKRSIEFTIKPARCLIAVNEISPPASSSPFLQTSNAQSSRRYLSNTYIYVDTEGKKEFRHANLDSKKTNIQI